MSEVTLPELDFDWAIWTIPKHKIKKPKDITPQSEIRSKAICLTKSAFLSHRHTEIWLTKYPTQGIFSDQTSYICRRHKNFRATKHQLLVADTKICEWQNTIYWLPTQGFMSGKTQCTGCRHKDLWVTKHNLLVADTRIY
jgi:hypothetical protein